MSEYKKAPDVEKMAEKLIGSHHSHLEDANIRYLFMEPKKTHGRILLGRMKLNSPLDTFVSGVDFVMLINEQFWIMASPDERKALVDHELCHGAQVEKKDGEMVYKLRPHDVEEFTEIVSRHGLWKNDLKEFGSVVRQMALAFPEGEKYDPKAAA